MKSKNHPSDTNAAELLQRLSRLLANDQLAHGLNPVQWEALRFFSKANRYSSSPSALTAYLGVTKGTVSQTIKALERKGMVRKQPLASDRRAVSIHLTAAGRRYLADDPLASLSRVLGNLPTKTEQELGTLLQELLVSMLSERQQQPFGKCCTCRHFQRKHADGDPHRCGLLELSLNADDAELICQEHQYA